MRANNNGIMYNSRYAQRIKDLMYSNNYGYDEYLETNAK